MSGVCGRTWTDGWGFHVCARTVDHAAAGAEHGCSCDQTLALDPAERPAPAGFPVTVGDLRPVEYFVGQYRRTVTLRVVSVRHRIDGRYRVEHSLEGSGLTVSDLSPVAILEPDGRPWVRPLFADDGR